MRPRRPNKYIGAGNIDLYVAKKEVVAGQIVTCDNVARPSVFRKAYWYFTGHTSN